MASYRITWPILKPGDLVYWSSETRGMEDSPLGGSGIVISVEPVPGLNRGADEIEVWWSCNQKLQTSRRKKLAILFPEDGCRA